MFWAIIAIAVAAVFVAMFIYSGLSELASAIRSTSRSEVTVYIYRGHPKPKYPPGYTIL